MWGKQGTTIGKYELLEELGSGSTGTVYEARVLYAPNPVAVKLIHPEPPPSSVES